MILNRGDQRHVNGLSLEGGVLASKKSEQKNRNNPSVGCSFSKKKRKKEKEDGASRTVKKKRKKCLQLLGRQDE